MTSYLILNFVVLAVLYMAVFVADSGIITRRWLRALGLMLVLTLIFDSLIIAAGIVAYDTTKLLGVYLARAPVEDFAYTLAVMLLVPLLWNWFRRQP